MLLWILLGALYLVALFALPPVPLDRRRVDASH